MELLVYPALFFVGLITGVLSGISGGGGAMLMVPFMIALGLGPQQAVATGKMSGLGAAFGGLSAFWKSGQVRKDILKVMILIAIIVGLITPLVFFKLDGELMQKIIGVLLIAMVPALFIRTHHLKKLNKKRQGFGYFLYSVVLSLQAVFGTGVGSVGLLVLTLFLNTSKLQANATNRAVTAILTPITFIALFLAGFVRLDYGLMAVTGSFIGTRVGSKIALREGETFVTYAMAIVVTISGILLLVS
jgi:uncharacterized membrane protein YfcA